MIRYARDATGAPLFSDMPSTKTFQTQNIEWQAKLQGVPLASLRSRALAFLVDATVVVFLLALPGAWVMLQGPRDGPLTLSVQLGGLGSVASKQTGKGT